jgi:hypothetical protein
MESSWPNASIPTTAEIAVHSPCAWFPLSRSNRGESIQNCPLANWIYRHVHCPIESMTDQLRLRTTPITWWSWHNWLSRGRLKDLQPNRSNPRPNAETTRGKLTVIWPHLKQIGPLRTNGRRSTISWRLAEWAKKKAPFDPAKRSGYSNVSKAVHAWNVVYLIPMAIKMSVQYLGNSILKCGKLQIISSKYVWRIYHLRSFAKIVRGAKGGSNVRWRESGLQHKILWMNVYFGSFHSGCIILLTHPNGVFLLLPDSFFRG